MSNYKPKHRGYKSQEQQSPQMSKEEYRIKKEQERSQAYEKIDEGITHTLESPDSFQEYLDIQARLDRYSVANTILIKEQLSTAKHYDFGAEGIYPSKRQHRCHLCC